VSSLLYSGNCHERRLKSAQNKLFLQLCTYLLTYRAEPFLGSCQLCSYSRTSQHFMVPEGSLPCSQEHSTSPYPEPDRSSPYHPIPFSLFKIYFNIVQVFLVVSFFLAFPPISYMNSSSAPFRLHALPTSSSLT
jgi:hypothetical protein